MPLDHLAAVERVHHQQRVGAVKQIFELHPAVAIIERGQHAVVKPRANPRWQILRRSHLAGDLVDPLEAVAGDFPHQHIGIVLQDRHNLAAELAHQRRDLVMRQPESGQVSHGGVEVAVGDPDALEIERSISTGTFAAAATASGWLRIAASKPRPK